MDGSAAAHRLIETLRLGVVPGREAASYTVARDDALAAMAADFDACVRDGGATRCWLGNYGAGKTHFLELTQSHALDRNFLVAQAVLDPGESAPSHPRRVYRSLVARLQFPDTSDRGLRTLLNRAIHDERALAAFDVDSRKLTFTSDTGQHLYLTPALRWARALTEGNHHAELRLLHDWLEGRSQTLTRDLNDTLRAATANQGHLYGLKDYRPWSRIYGYLLSGIASLAKTMGYSGLVVLLDEAEFYSILSEEDQSYAQSLFQALSYAATGTSTDLPFLSEELDGGGAGVLRSLPPRYDDAPGLYVCFAMTPHDAGVAALGRAIPAACITELTKLTTADYTTLVGNIVRLFREARPARPLPEGIHVPLSQVLEGLLKTGVVDNPRQGIKFLVDFLDIATVEPQELRTVFQTLRQQLPL